MSAAGNGALPAGWDAKTIESLAEPNGIAYGVLKPGPNTPDGVPMLRVSDIRDGKVDPSAIYRIEPSLDKQYTRTKLQGGEVVLSIQGSVGRAAVVPDSLAGANISRTLAMIRLEEPRLAHWVRRALESPQVQAAIRGAVGGTTRDSLNLRDLRKLVIPVAEGPERDRVLEHLDDIDASRASIADRLAAARMIVDRLRTAVLAAACSGRLTADWRDEHAEEPAVDVAAAVERRRSETRRFDEPVLNPHAELEDLPQTWRVAPLGLLLTDLQYGTSKRCAYDTPGVPVLRIPNVSTGIVTLGDIKFAALDDREAAALKLRTGDLLMIRSNGSVGLVGLTAEVPADAAGAAYAGYLIRLRGDPDYLTPGFIALALASPRLRQQIEIPARSTSGVHNINSREVRSLGVPIPPLAEQREIVIRATAALRTAEQAKLSIAAAEADLERTIRAVLRSAFSGQRSPA